LTLSPQPQRGLWNAVSKI